MTLMPMRDMVPPPNASTDPERNVPAAAFERLRALVSEWGWEPMVTVSEDDPPTYTGWMRRTEKERGFRTLPARTAESAALALIEKVTPYSKAAES